MTNRSATSLIEDHEEEEAKKLLLEKYKAYDPNFYLPIATGSNIVVALNIREKDHAIGVNPETGEKMTLIIPEGVRREDQYIACTGCVLAVGPNAYQDTEYFSKGPYVKVGDFISFARHAGVQYGFKGIPVHVIPHTAPLQVLKDPKDVELLK